MRVSSFAVLETWFGLLASAENHAQKISLLDVSLLISS
jgi:hypothetical protein